ncbi:MAG: class I SAM-dependent methyltransferase [Pseudomonadota bacterium]
MEELTIEFDSAVPLAPVNSLNEYCKRTALSITERKSGRIPQFQAADGHIIWPLLNTVINRVELRPNAEFCELGAGIGLVTLMASRLKLRATGIEIEPELVDLAIHTAGHFQIPSRFLHADMFHAPENTYQHTDLFFAYPWPSQEESVIQLFNREGKPGAILICYRGGLQYRVLQKHNDY